MPEDSVGLLAPCVPLPWRLSLVLEGVEGEGIGAGREMEVRGVCGGGGGTQGGKRGDLVRPQGWQGLLVHPSLSGV